MNKQSRAEKMILAATERWNSILSEQREAFVDKFSEIFNERIKWDNSEWTAEEYVEIEEKGIDITGYILLSGLHYLMWWDMYDEFNDLCPDTPRNDLWEYAGRTIVETEPGYKVVIEALDEMEF